MTEDFERRPLAMGAGGQEPPHRPATTGTVGPDDLFATLDRMRNHEVVAFIRALRDRYDLERPHRQKYGRHGLMGVCARCDHEWPCVGYLVTIR